MKQNQLRNALLLAAVISTGVIACSKNYETGTQVTAAPLPADENASVPSAYHIQASEKLEIPASIDLPANLPGGNTRVATYYATGVQKYKAQVKAGSDPVAYEWVFTGPQADLFDINNKKVGTHGGGPFWEISPSDSIFAQAYSPAKTAPSPVGAIDWLLLMPKVGKVPTGIFSDVLYIQRIATTGGKAPQAAPTSIADVANVPYTAVYRFTRKN